MKTQTLEQWLVRLDRAAQLLESRLDDPPTLGELADAAACSPFHFHRIWRALIGEPVGQTIARLRIEAAQEQLSTGSSVTTAAMAAGFGTPQSFSRAFRKQAGVPPSQWRSGYLPQATGPVEIVRREDTVVVTLRAEGRPYIGLNDIFGALVSWADQKGDLADVQGLYGLPQDDPGSLQEHELRYDAAIALELPEVEPPYGRGVIAGGPYALVLHEGSYDTLEEATQALLFGALLAGHDPADQPIVYSFLNDPEETPAADLRTEILLPLLEKPQC